MGNTIKRIIKSFVTIILFLAAFLLVGVLLTDLLRHKWSYEKDNASQQIVQGYYKEEKGTLDVLYLGASTVRNGISPLEMFNEYGFTGYSRATSIQTPEISYHLLMETLEEQDIKAVVMDSTTLGNVLDNVTGLSGKIHEAVDYMPYNKTKFELVKEISEVRDIDAIEFLLPLYTYHDRWEELEKNDFIYKTWGEQYVFKGQYPTLKTHVYTFAKEYMDEEAESKDSEYYLSEEAKDYFAKMIDVCKERGIEFIMLRTPVASWDWDKYHLVNDYAEAHGVTYFDFCLPELREAIDFNPKRDYADDGRHLNVTGAKKVSHYLGQYIADTCKLEDKRTNPQYESWNMDYAHYTNLLYDVDLMRENNLVEFLKMLQDNPNYLVLMASRNDTSKYFGEDLENIMKKVGIDTDNFKTSFQSYLAIMDNGQVTYQQGSNGTQVDYFVTMNGLQLEMSSFANPTIGNNTTLSIDGKQYSPNKNGLNVVVYDKSTEQVVVRKAFNMGQNGTEYKERIFIQDPDLKKLHSDPAEYFKAIADDKYVSVICVNNDGAKYLADSVDRSMTSLGMESLVSMYKKPYISVMDGSKVVFTKVGEKKNSTLQKRIEVDGLTIDVSSSTVPGGCESIITMLERDITNKTSGVFSVVYNTETKKIVDKHVFRWSKILHSENNYKKIESLDEYLDTAADEGLDVYCLYRFRKNEINPETAKILRENGFNITDLESNYIGMKSGNKTIFEEAKPTKFTRIRDLGNGREIRLKAEMGKVTMKKDHVKYVINHYGAVTIVYDVNKGAIVSIRNWQ